MATICTFNANNLFVRYRFGESYPGARSTRPGTGQAAPNPRFGFLPTYEPNSFEVFNDGQRRLAATALTRGDGVLPDLVCLQEIESLIALRSFNERYLKGHYRQALLVDSRDFRQIDVGVLAADTVEVVAVRSHVDQLAPEDRRYRADWPWQFSRDCVEVETRLPGGRTFTVFINHLKSKFVAPPHRDLPADELKDWMEKERRRAATYRLHQAEAIADLVHARFPGRKFDREWFAVVGDLNTLSAEPPAAALAAAGLHDVVSRLPADERWTEYYPAGGSVGQLDYLFVSPRLADATDGQLPSIERAGIGMRDRSKVDHRPLPKKVRHVVADDAPPAATVDFQFDRFPGVDPRHRASDHCPIFFELL